MIRRLIVALALTFGLVAVALPADAVIFVDISPHYVGAYGCSIKVQWTTIHTVRVTLTSGSYTCEKIGVHAFGQPISPPCPSPCTITVKSGHTGPSASRWWAKQGQYAQSSVTASDWYANLAYVDVISSGGLERDWLFFANGEIH